MLISLFIAIEPVVGYDSYMTSVVLDYMTLLSVYAPTLTSDESSKDRFYDNLRSALRSVPRPRIKLLYSVTSMPGLGQITTYGTESLVNTVWATSTVTVCGC